MALFAGTSITCTLHLAPDCRKLCVTQNLNGATRTAELPQGSSDDPSEVEANRLMALSMWLILLCLIYGVRFGFEHPMHSRGFQFKLMLWLLGLVAHGLIFAVDYVRQLCSWYSAFRLGSGKWRRAHAQEHQVHYE